MKIVTLCTCGLGTCFALKIKTEEALSELGVFCEVVPCDLSSGFLEEADLYVLPYGLDVGEEALQSRSVLVVEDVLDAEEIRDKIKKYFAEAGMEAE
ncbi:MAG: hypothetical protein LUE92_04030 [Clostridiales bacterium]|nr:hypothetical protein [Clostridiales bacterium]